MKQEVAYWLVRHQFICSEKAGRFSSARVWREDIEDFHAQHAFGRDIAVFLKKSPKHTVLLLAEQGIHPLLADGSPDECRQVVYRLDGRLREFLAETGTEFLTSGIGRPKDGSSCFRLRNSSKGPC